MSHTWLDIKILLRIYKKIKVINLIVSGFNEYLNSKIIDRYYIVLYLIYVDRYM